MPKSMLVLGAVLLLLSCSDGHEDETTVRTSSDLLQIEKKYYLEDCMVKVDFHWGEPLNYAFRARITDSVGEQINQVVVLNAFPLFSGHTNYTRDYYVLYFSDKCENRLDFANRLIQKYFFPNIDGFPAYSIDADVTPGFDGITPSGWWLDH